MSEKKSNFLTELRGWLYFLLTVAIVVGVVWGVIYSVRSFNRVATGVSVVEPESGVHCALATSTDGVAIDCWQVNE